MRLVEGAHGTLFALDASTGRELWSSGAAISDWTHFSMPAVANGRVFVTTNHGHVYAFGLGPDRGEHTYAPASPPAAAATPAPEKPADGGTPPAAPSSAPASQALFTVHCASCHGNGGEGRASAHTPDMRDAAWQQARTAAGIDAVIRKGKEGGMPPFEQVLSAQQIEQLVAFVRALR
jgi:mono/diheme cytochrome c family protein